MNLRIHEILQQLVGIYSLSYSKAELEPAIWFYDFFKSLPYFADHPDDYGLYDIPDDPFGRKIPYAFIQGRKKDTVVFSGHFDVVTAEDYGPAIGHAFDISSDDLVEALKSFNLTETQKADLYSGEWLFGRGVADMKGGLAIHAFLFEQYAELAVKGDLEGSVLFMPVPDEESYSTGMRNGAAILKSFKEKYSLDYKLLIDPEPTADVNGTMNISIGTIGKCMPALLVQGKRAHSGHCFEGISSLGIISEIYLATNGSMDFVDVYKDEAAVPPCWLNMRDMKTGYDVSLPQRSGGYISALTFSTTPEELIARIKDISKNALIHQIEKLNSEYQQYKKLNVHETKDEISYEPVVLEFSELKASLHKRDGEQFDSFFAEAYEKANQDVEAGRENFPSATLKLMNDVLDYSGMSDPCVIIGFAPPYYPPVNADLVRGKEGCGTRYYEFIQKVNREFGQEVSFENFFTGISDLSYAAITAPFNEEAYTGNTPMWGHGYSIDFNSIDGINIPGIIYGPRGKDYHTYAERVNKYNLYVTVPETTGKLVEYAWKL